ncbi:MAG: hypothetical protein JW768_13845 [Chitinispirillaceae bacterium]|nr:hypothetical protein [Chitinispirillaceae bacterium]
MQARHMLIALLLCSLWSRIPADSDSLVWHLRLDGITTISYDHEYSLPDGGMFGVSRIHADPPLSFFSGLHTMHDTAKSWSIVCSGTAASETGDPLLNTYLEPGLRNRDHETRTILSVRKGALEASAIRTYNDLYSRRFDSLWNESLPGSENASYGLLTEDAAVAGVRTDRAGWSGSLSRYRRWNMAPLFYTPLFSRGISSEHEAVMNMNSGWIRVKGGIDFRDRYELSAQPAERTCTWVVAEGTQQMTDSLGVSMQLERRSETTPRSSAGLRFDWRTPLGSFSPWCSIYENGRPLAGLRALVPVAPGVKIEGVLEECYEPAGESVSFIRSDDTVRYRPEDAAYGAAHVTGSYSQGYGVVTVSTRTWFEYASATRIEAWDTASFRNIMANYTSLDRDAYAGGAAFTSSVRHGQWSVSLVGAGHRLFNNSIQSLYLPWNWRMSVQYGNPQSDSIRASIICEGSGPAEVAQLSAGVIQRERSGHREAVTISIAIPFYPPVARDRLRAVFHINAGPFCLAPRAEAPQHPFGNPIGPVIAIKFEVLFANR